MPSPLAEAPYAPRPAVPSLAEYFIRRIRLEPSAMNTPPSRKVAAVLLEQGARRRQHLSSIPLPSGRGDPRTTGSLGSHAARRGCSVPSHTRGSRREPCCPHALAFRREARYEDGRHRRHPARRSLSARHGAPPPRRCHLTSPTPPSPRGSCPYPVTSPMLASSPAARMRGEARPRFASPALRVMGATRGRREERENGGGSRDGREGGRWEVEEGGGAAAIAWRG